MEDRECLAVWEEEGRQPAAWDQDGNIQWSGKRTANITPWGKGRNSISLCGKSTMNIPLFGKRMEKHCLFGKRTVSLPLSGKRALNLPLSGKRTVNLPLLRHHGLSILTAAQPRSQRGEERGNTLSVGEPAKKHTEVEPVGQGCLVDEDLWLAMECMYGGTSQDVVRHRGLAEGGMAAVR
ncbi:uncharacterized protein LOC120506264 isoform X2 [Passer montanus]|uniref:uncharacterized protein LOC120506264 isoform X2 n=1 Tax=Passer montanus TaxID=9160 RepID=UPI00196142F1|nr:uncharacterized protein LOC120506264 isoform X2 [Passer montanus]